MSVPLQRAPADLGLNDVGDLQGRNGLTVQEVVCGFDRMTVVKFNRVRVTLNRYASGDPEDTWWASGGLQLYQLPIGFQRILGLVGSLELSCSGFSSAALGATVGTEEVGVDDGAFTSGETDLAIAGAAVMTAGAGSCVITPSTNIVLVDGSEDAGEIWLNFALADEDIIAEKVLEVTGTLVVNWTHLGNPT